MKKTNSHISKNNDSKVLNERLPFFDRPEVIKWILRLFYIACAVLLALDFIIHRYIYTDIEKVPAFYAIYGCAACVILVLVATQMRKLLMRDEEYYEPSAQNENNKQKGG